MAEEHTHILPKDPDLRKNIPLHTCLFRYFPKALAAIAYHSKMSNEQHNPGTEPHWDRTKSADELDAMLRHSMDQEALPMAWRGLANLEKEIEKHPDLETFLKTLTYDT